MNYLYMVWLRVPGSIHCPPQSVQMTSLPSFLRALATRWPQEIFSLDAIRMFTCVTLSIQILNELFDMLGKIQGVLPGQALGEFDVPVLKGFDNVDMIDDGSLGAIILGNGSHPN